MKLIHSKLALLFFSLLVCFVVAPPVSSQENDTPTPYDLIVTPPTAYLRIKPGTPAVHTITLKNNGLSTLEVTPQLVDFSADGTSGQPVLSTTHTFPYLDQDKTSFEPVQLQPQATAQLMLHFTIPGSAENKEYPLSVLFKGTLVEKDAVSGLTPVSGIIASNLIVLISDTEALEKQFSIEDFDLPPLIDSFGKISFSPLVKNNSFAAAVASGSATITNWRGTKVAQFEISPSVILGYSTKNIVPAPSQEAGSVPDGNFFEFDEPFLIGPYTISINFSPGSSENNAHIEHKIVVWAVPLSLIAAGAVACFALAGYYFYKKRSPFY